MSYFTKGRWGLCDTCDATDDERCRNILNGRNMRTVHKGRNRINQPQPERSGLYTPDPRITSNAPIDAGVITGLTFKEPIPGMLPAPVDQPEKKPTGARLVEQSVHPDHMTGELKVKNTYSYDVIVPRLENTWAAWNNLGTAATTAAIQFENQTRIWNEWTTITTGYIQAAAITTNSVWNEWNTSQRYSLPRPVPNQEELDRRQAQREEASRRTLERQAKLQGAQERSMELLEMILTDEERIYRKQHQETILVRSQHGNMYELDISGIRGVHGNITLVDEHGCRLGNLCVAPGMWDTESSASLPMGDGWVGQYLALKFNEDALLAKANWSRRRPCEMPGVPILGQRQVA